MAIGPKTEDRIKELLDEHYTKSQEQLVNHTTGLFLWGFVIGILFSYTGILLPFSIGTFVGYSLARKNIPLVNSYLLQFNSYVDVGYQLLANKFF